MSIRPSKSCLPEPRRPGTSAPDRGTAPPEPDAQSGPRICPSLPIASALLALCLLLASCTAEEQQAGETFIAYRDRIRNDSAAVRGIPVYIVNRGNSKYVKDGAAVINGLKVVSDGNMAWFLEQIGELGFFGDSSESQDMKSALESLPKSQLIVVEKDGRIRVLAGGTPDPGEPQSVERARNFSRIKMALVELSQDQTSFQVVPNKEGAAYFTRLQKELEEKWRKQEGGN